MLCRSLSPRFAVLVIEIRNIIDVSYQLFECSIAGYCTLLKPVEEVYFLRFIRDGGHNSE